MHPAIHEKLDQIVAACRLHAVSRLDLFGSALRDDTFDPIRSDVDFLVDFAPEAKTEHYLGLEEAFERIFGRPVDLVDRQALQASRNYIRARHILSQAQTLYGA